jgi:hypothetical protein
MNFTNKNVPDSLSSKVFENELALPQVMVIMGIVSFVFFAIIIYFDSYLQRVLISGDNGSYISIASSIRHRDFHNFSSSHFWGLSYAITALSSLMSFTEIVSLIVISFCSSIVCTLLTYSLFGLLETKLPQKSYVDTSSIRSKSN